MRTGFGRTAYMLFLSGLSLLFTSCLIFRQTLTFNRDSSCVVTYEYSFPEEYAGLWQNIHASLGDRQNFPGNNFLNEQAVRRFFTENGLEVRQYRQYIQDQIRHTEIIVLARDGEKALNSGIFGDFQLSKSPLGDFLFKGKLTPPPNDLSQEALIHLHKMAEGFSFQFRLQVPTEIISSNGRRMDYRQVEWNYSWPAGAESSPIFAPEPQTLEATW